MYAYVEQSFIYRCYGSVFVRVYVHSQILSVITYRVFSSLLTTYCNDFIAFIL